MKHGAIQGRALQNQSVRLALVGLRIKHAVLIRTRYKAILDIHRERQGWRRQRQRFQRQNHLGRASGPHSTQVISRTNYMMRLFPRYVCAYTQKLSTCLRMLCICQLVVNSASLPCTFGSTRVSLSIQFSFHARLQRLVYPREKSH